MSQNQKKVRMTVDLHCAACGSLYHRGDSPPKFCPCCGAGYDRYCIKCHKKVDMYFEEYWPDEDECVRTYSPAKRCPRCNAGLEVPGREPGLDEPGFEH